MLEAQASDVEVHVLSRSAFSAGSLTSQPTVHEVDILDQAAVTRAIEVSSCTHLCHMGWLGAENANRYESPENKRWVEASEHLFETFSAHSGNRIVQVGSCIEYGNDIDGAQSESNPLQSDTAYGQAKAEVSEVVLNGFGNDTTSAVARLFFCYGRYEQSERLVPSIISSLIKGQPLDLTEGRQRRDYLDARDVARALVAILNSDAEGAFNVGSGVSVEVRRLAEILGEAMGGHELLRFGARAEGADTAFEILADTSRIQSVIGWTPTITLEDGLEDSINWWRQVAQAQL